ncbi:hypothetical protein NG819_02630 [Pseudarthrobacter sp. Fe7]|nr:hypothetical protein NG819_02630 [Pseudarthrobacter sp. Fe7]
MTAVPSSVRLARTAVVADPDAGRLARNAEALRDAGYTVLEAADANGLAALLDAAQPSVVVTDALLSPVQSAAPVLVMVDLDNPQEIAAANPPGVHDCITKPPEPKELVHRATVLIEQVSRRRASRQVAEGLREQAPRGFRGRARHQRSPGDRQPRRLRVRPDLQGRPRSPCHLRGPPGPGDHGNLATAGRGATAAGRASRRGGGPRNG